MTEAETVEQLLAEKPAIVGMMLALGQAVFAMIGTSANMGHNSPEGTYYYVHLPPDDDSAASILRAYIDGGGVSELQERWPDLVWDAQRFVSLVVSDSIKGGEDLQ